MIRIVVDENISFAEEAFSSLGEIRLLHGRKIDNNALKDADALIIRSITSVNEELLKDTPVRFVGTATIGTDHVDTCYLKERGIAFSSAKGCNADAVTEYVFTAIMNVAKEKGVTLKGRSLGVIGVGNIGSRVSRLGSALGMEVLKNDPPLRRKTGSSEYTGLEEALKADIVTFHVPLNMQGEDRTYHLIDSEKLKLVKPGAIVINASRGPVINNKALLECLSSRTDISVVLDVWENEPSISSKLLEKVDIASPHIAGYSLEGKINGTLIIREALCRFLECRKGYKAQLPEIENPVIEADGSLPMESFLSGVFGCVYDIKEDDRLMRQIPELLPEEKGYYFDELRKHYRLRREFNNYSVRISPFSKTIADTLRAFRFKISL
ncbi:MAG: 4-phosphoerythronate dehydrogenase [Ignavibacteria bacterium]|jgi:erythronate-4-phosphate dehydrogenase|nr:4-phosphoerythronate dehydrogenase [Ignavibacteria bacterium]MCU7503277.1 4-phosphoerythronate dehydrogenase [Ignavibacteria bacterium]MCU7515777.1 4-phosphoerythronate dehydrogenase [Ignavibacteria bacterium]